LIRQERLYAWLSGLRASDACAGLLMKLADQGLGTQQRMKLEALRVRLLPPQLWCRTQGKMLLKLVSACLPAP
jgi:hypothetical protein